METDTDLTQEMSSVTANLTWLDRCTCAQSPLERFFVKAGHTIDDETLARARACPVRREEVIWAYARDLRYGYFGGLSAGQRAAMSLEQALDFIASDDGTACTTPRQVSG